MASFISTKQKKRLSYFVMKKSFKLSSIILTLLLSSCSEGFSSSSIKSEDSSSSDTSSLVESSSSILDESSSIEGSSSIESGSSLAEESSNEESSSKEESASESSSKEEDQIEKVSLEEAKSACLEFEGNPNEVGLVIGKRSFEVEGLVISIFDFGKSTKAYNGTEKYKATITDGASFLTVALKEEFYKKVKDYVGKEDSIYKIAGRESRLNGKAELIATSFEFLSTSTTRFTNEEMISIACKSNSIEESYSRLKESPLNEAGNYDGRISSIKLRFVEKVVDSVWLFTDGNKFVTLHGPSKSYNSFKSTTKAVNVLVQENIYKYSLSFEYICHVNLDEEISIPETGREIEESELYKTHPSKDSSSHFARYEELKMNTYTFNGYVDYYDKSGKIFFVLSSTKNVLEGTSRTKEVARSKQALFVSNDSESNLYESQLTYSKLYESYQNDEEVSLTIYPYLWNSENYFQVHVHFN